ncbi:Gfo/Idh/MocA family protein [Halopseudomonas salegens]|uniref:Predicted dehydrogenase n=1 Tax=Halopseudomonas salegens TaxID=1434072 RepID=A0A1H2E4S6_9GAMM|nr:Gfo/Idh/MocA family oxidoreductase [Halopseudomonas salegens]SDT90117.1 Predicted dehydrogenase [Halopseudomonas salegens]
MKHNTRKKTGVGLIGGGLVAYLHTLGIRSSNSAQLTAISSRSETRAKHMGLLVGVPHYQFADHHSMLSQPDVDLVIVGSPNGTHAEHAKESIAAGKAIVVEKPLTLTLADAAALVKLENDGAFIGYAENHIFAPIMVELRRQMERGVIGDVQRIESHFYNPPLPPGNWHASSSLAGGGALVDLGSHVIATFDWLLAEDQLKEVSSVTIEIDDQTGFDRRADAVMASSRGVDLTLSVGFGIDPLGCGYKVVGSTGTLEAKFMPEPQMLTLQRKGGDAVPISFNSWTEATLRGMFTRSGYAPQIDHFCAALSSATKPLLGAVEGERTLRWLAACYHCATTKRAVSLDTQLSDDSTPIAHMAL